jgi:hypothetical protein
VVDTSATAGQISMTIRFQSKAVKNSIFSYDQAENDDQGEQIGQIFAYV